MAIKKYIHDVKNKIDITSRSAIYQYFTKLKEGKVLHNTNRWSTFYNEWMKSGTGIRYTLAYTTMMGITDQETPLRQHINKLFSNTKTIGQKTSVRRGLLKIGGGTKGLTFYAYNNGKYTSLDRSPMMLHGTSNSIIQTTNILINKIYGKVKTEVNPHDVVRESGEIKGLSRLLDTLNTHSMFINDGIEIISKVYNQFDNLLNNNSSPNYAIVVNLENNKVVITSESVNNRNTKPTDITSNVMDEEWDVRYNRISLSHKGLIDVGLSDLTIDLLNKYNIRSDWTTMINESSKIIGLFNLSNVLPTNLDSKNYDEKKQQTNNTAQIFLTHLQKMINVMSDTQTAINKIIKQLDKNKNENIKATFDDIAKNYKF